MPWFQPLTAEEVHLIELFKKSEAATVEEFCHAHILQKITKEVIHYSSLKNSKLSQTDPEALCDFNYRKIYDELTVHVPSLTDIIRSSCSINITKRQNTAKTIDSVLPIIVTIVSKVLSAHNERLSAVKYINSIILKKGGSKDSCINRFAYSGDSVTQRSVANKLKELSAHALDRLNFWDIPSTESCIVFDNINPYVHVHQQTIDHKSKLYNLTQAVAVKFKAPVAADGPPIINLPDVSVQDLLPTDNNKQHILSYFSIIVRNIWAKHIPALDWMTTDMPKHTYSEYAARKSEIVSITTKIVIKLHSTTKLGYLVLLIYF